VSGVCRFVAIEIAWGNFGDVFCSRAHNRAVRDGIDTPCTSSTRPGAQWQVKQHTKELETSPCNPRRERRAIFWWRKEGRKK
jgi:hypothetical protein